jgi:uncharacterized protein with von Willebrand factor type A (vWA) domain
MLKSRPEHLSRIFTYKDPASGIIDYYDSNETAGIVWFERIVKHFRRCVWLNPMPERYWRHPTVSTIRQVLPMFHLSLEGIDEAIQKLTGL